MTKTYLTEEEIETAHGMFMAGTPVKEVAAAMNRNLQTIYDLKRRMIQAGIEFPKTTKKTGNQKGKMQNALFAQLKNASGEKQIMAANDESDPIIDALANAPEPLGYDNRRVMAEAPKPMSAFTVSDVGLAAALQLKGHEIVQKRRSFAVWFFVFEDTAQAANDRRRYFEDNLPVDAHSYFANLKRLKIEMTNLPEHVEDAPLKEKIKTEEYK